MIILNSVVSFIVSAIAGMGIGGGGLLVIYLVLVLSMEQLQAQGLNLSFFIFSSISALCVHLKKRDIEINDVRIIAVTGVLSSFLGSNLSTVINSSVLREIFAAMLIVTGLIALFKKDKQRQ